MKIKMKTEGSYFVIVALAILLIASFYLINTKNSQVDNLNSDLLELRNEVDSYLAIYQSDSEDAQGILYQLCIRDTICKENYSKNLRYVYLENLGIVNFTYDKRDARFVIDELPKFEGKLNEFIYSSCPGFKITDLGRLYSIYYYDHPNGKIGIIMNDDFVTLRCSWVYIPEEDNYFLLE